MNLKVTYYLDITSSWCHWAEPAWAAVRARYAGRVAFDWQLSLLPAEAVAASVEQCEWFYRRSGTIVRSPYMLNSGWYEPGVKDYSAPNLVAEAARGLGVADDSVRLALAHAALREGRRVGQWGEAVDVAVAAAGGRLSAGELRRAAESAETRAIVEASTARFEQLQMTQRPSFFLENNIGDRAMLSGLWTAAPLEALIESMLQDSAAYAVHAAHFGGPPA